MVSPPLAYCCRRWPRLTLSPTSEYSSRLSDPSVAAATSPADSPMPSSQGGRPSAAHQVREVPDPPPLAALLLGEAAVQQPTQAHAGFVTVDNRRERQPGPAQRAGGSGASPLGQLEKQPLQILTDGGFRGPAGDRVR